MKVVASVENECKFCGWKKTDKQMPIFRTRGITVYAFCPMCNFELNISEQNVEEEAIVSND